MHETAFCILQIVKNSFNKYIYFNIKLIGFINMLFNPAEEKTKKFCRKKLSIGIEKINKNDL